jgi:hypothetical protein
MDTNGLPEGATLATLEAIAPAFSEWVNLPEASKRLGKDCRVKVWAIPQGLYLSFIPIEYALVQVGEGEDRAGRIREFIAGLSTEQAQSFRTREEAVTFKVIAAGCMEPTVTEAEAKKFGPDAATLAKAILVKSGILDG